MRSQENYTPFLVVALSLTLAILITFQTYILREPARITADEARDQSVAVAQGRMLYAANCTTCHGEEGEGVDAPPLNDKKFLSETSDEIIFNLINTGVPGTEMPAWNQAYGGPFTDHQVRQLVAFMRGWEPNAPDRQALPPVGNPTNGLVIFSSTCAVCHGPEGKGTERAPALNDPVKLAQFDDEWYADTIADGRLAKGMPTWGTVLSPAQIRDLVALLRAWQRGEMVEAAGLGPALMEARERLERGDLHDAEHALEEAARNASGEMLAALTEALEALEAGDQATAEEAIRQAAEFLGIEKERH